MGCSSMTTFLPTIRQLQYLVALNDHGHFGRAAEACFVSQSTLSAALRELESHIGLTLVERTSRVVRFTPAGTAITDKARRVLREAGELADMARAAGEPLVGELRMGVIPTIAPFLLPIVLPRLRERYPELRLYLREEASQVACESLQRGQLDCVLLAMPFACGDIDSEALFDDPLVLAFPPGEKDVPATMSPNDLDPARLLLLEDGHCLQDHALAACNRPNLQSGSMTLGTSLNTLVQMVENGLGVTLIPQMAVDAGVLSYTGIQVRKLNSATATRQITLIWRRGSPRAKEFQLLAETLRPQKA